MVITITFTDITQPPQSLFTLLSKGSQAGYSVAPVNRNLPLTLTGRCCYLSVQASSTNGNGTTVYKGDENVKTDGSCQGKELTPGTIDAEQGDQNVTHLQEIYLTASANGLKANVEVHWN